MAEKLRHTPKILEELETHEIGFHSSAHSVHPTIFEYCDVGNYEDAYALSIRRETSHVNPLSGETEGNGGLIALRELFPSKNVQAYRAPGFCCPPPHLEAMAALRIRYDFSWGLSKDPACFKGITFYPRPIFLDCETALLAGKRTIANWSILLASISVTETLVLDFHPHDFVNREYWDSAYHKHNPSELIRVPSRTAKQTESMFRRFDILLKTVRHLEELKMVNTQPDLTLPYRELDASELDITLLADMCSYWPKKFFEYEPKNIKSQLQEYFGHSD
jgi:hypothetical protein